MVIVYPKVDKIENDIKTYEYDITKVKFDMDKMLAVEKIEWNQKIGNMISRDLTQATGNVKNMKGMVNKLENQLKQ